MSDPEAFSIESPALPVGTRVAAFEGREALSETYLYRLWLLMPGSATADFDVGAATLADARFAQHREDGSLRRQVHGVLSSLELLDEHPGGDALYVAEIVPNFWKLRLSRHSRVWADRTLPQIIRDVFRKAGLEDARWSDRLTASRYKPIDHVCQYRESDFDFLSRWFEREGIYYFFEQGDAGETLVLVDAIARQGEAEDGTVPYVPELGEGGASHEGLRRFTQRERYTLRDVRVRDHDPLKPTTAIDVTETSVATRAPTQVRHMEDIALDTTPAQRFARVRAAEASAMRSLFQGEGRVFGVAPGFKFHLVDHPRASFNRGYQCVALRTRGRMQGGEEVLRRWVPWVDDGAHWSALEATPDNVQFRAPIRSPRPTVTGLEVACVDGPATSDYAQLDAHGRYLLRFRFDENEGPDGTHSTRVRMLQPHAGAPEGMHFPLRKGTEVLVAFIAGDPDRPVIAGAVPDRDHPSPVTSGNETQNVIQTGGENRIEIEDLAGSQYVDISTPPERTFIHLGAHHGQHQHNYITSTDGNGLLHTGGNLDVTVGGDKHEHVVKTLRETYHATQTSEVTGTVTETHCTNMTTTVTSHVQENYRSHTTNVGGKTVEHCASQRTSVSGHLQESHGVHNVKVDQRLYVRSGSHDATTHGVSDCRFGTLLINVKGAFTLTSAGPISISALNWQDNAPVAYRIITTTRKKVNSVEFNVHPMFFEAIAAKRSMALATITINRSKVDAVLLARAINGIKLDYTAAKIEAVGMKIKFRQVLKNRTVSLFGHTFAVGLFA